MGNNEIEVWILLRQHFNRCQASYHINNKGNPVAPRHLIYLATGKRVETVNLQAAKAIAFDRSTDHEFDAPLKILARKHRSSVTSMACKYETTTETVYGPRKCFQVVVQRGGGKKPRVAQFGSCMSQKFHTIDSALIEYGIPQL